MADPFRPYAALFEHPNGPGDQRPTALDIVRDNDALGTYSGKVALVTGGTNGIGTETVRALHATGADVYFTARDAAKGEKTRRDLLAKSEGKGKLEVILMDLDSLESVRNAAKAFLEKSDKLNILVNNAGIMATPYSKTADGFERQFGVNHLAHYLLTVLLLPTLQASATPSLASRVVFVSSSSHRYSKINWENYNYTAETYDPFLAYGQSKTANVWTANYIDRVFGPRGVHALSLHPGGIWTGLQEFVDPAMKAEFEKDPNILPNMLTPEQGAATTLWAAVGKVWEGKGGEYLADCGVALPETGDMMSPMSNKAAPWVKGEVEDEDRLWELSARLVGVEAQK